MSDVLSQVPNSGQALYPMPRSLAPHAGMPALDESANETSWFEFASPRYFYIPVAMWCAWLSLKHFGIRSPINANPSVPFSGMVGESKSQVLDGVTGDSRNMVARYGTIYRRAGEDGANDTTTNALAKMAELNLSFPVVVKPDLGMRGAGVQVAKSEADLRQYIEDFPADSQFLVQELIDEEGEAGVFYVRHPDWERGKLISLTLKYFPRVVGTGEHSLRELIQSDPRAGQVSHLYTGRFADELDKILPAGESKRLAFAGNHCRGTIFRNGNDHITDAMTDAFDRIAKDMGEFFVGRFDVRFGDFEALKRGEGFRIIEVNGAGGEATHIWDSRMTLRGAYASLMQQFSHIYAIGAKNRRRGFRPASYREFIKAWREETRLTEDYPITH